MFPIEDCPTGCIYFAIKNIFFDSTTNKRAEQRRDACWIDYMDALGKNPQVK